jgi:EAL domain-containing protein (putative c-di-GMP-specific phosphodiesterase class I)
VHPEFGTQAYLDFLPLAQDLGLVESLGTWVLSEACAAAERWAAQGLAFGRVSVNVRAAQIAGGHFVVALSDILATSGLAGSHLMLEFSEGLLDTQVSSTLDLIAALQQLGVGISLDHFGAGASSLAQIRNLPVSEIKIDDAFVRGLGRGTADRAIVAASIVLGHHLDVRVVALGVDTPEQLFALHELSCDMQQGGLFSAPLPEAELVALLRRSGN